MKAGQSISQQYTYRLNRQSIIINIEKEYIEMVKFCSGCGSPLVNETSKFCDKCGANTGEVNVDRHNQIIDNPKKNYSSNHILTLLLILGVVFIFINFIIVWLIVIISAIAVYYDANTIRAGKSSPKEEVFNSMTYKPITWGALTFLFWIIFLPLYLYRRERIFNQNF